MLCVISRPSKLIKPNGYIMTCLPPTAHDATLTRSFRHTSYSSPQPIPRPEPGRLSISISSVTGKSSLLPLSPMLMLNAPPLPLPLPSPGPHTDENSIESLPRLVEVPREYEDVLPWRRLALWRSRRRKSSTRVHIMLCMARCGL